MDTVNYELCWALEIPHVQGPAGSKASNHLAKIIIPDQQVEVGLILHYGGAEECVKLKLALGYLLAHYYGIVTENRQAQQFSPEKGMVSKSSGPLRVEDQEGATPQTCEDHGNHGQVLCSNAPSRKNFRISCKESS